MNAIHVHIMNKMQNAFLRIINDFHCKDNACKFSIFFSHVTKKMLVCALSIFPSLVNQWLKIVLWYIEISCLYIYRCIISFPVFLSSAVNINIFVAIIEISFIGIQLLMYFYSTIYGITENVETEYVLYLELNISIRSINYFRMFVYKGLFFRQMILHDVEMSATYISKNFHSFLL